MVTHVISPDYGWLESKNGTKTAQWVIKPGKNRDGYFTNDNVLEQFQEMVEIVKADYPNDDHVFFYDNAATHLKHAPNSLSAHHMPQNTPKPGKNWLVNIPELGNDGKPLKSTTGKIKEIRVKMSNAIFNGQPQSLYFPDGHPHAGVFKGMAVILEEQGYDVKDLRAECKKFCCPGGEIWDCCCRQLLYTEPDFIGVKSLLEELAESLGV
ncbi:hypothetical protein NP233_g11034 [Leucocoprinus birnbaumii]|uniref:Uncharacterized protein n=1 Tax=Leucocoprinus birnbaumii TaxID=56174 RepID=A0AAD5YLM7_9AGAR|nr:hypothetical protein NP233_g11034 [Leucocoprinus birnbaumii]